MLHELWRAPYVDLDHYLGRWYEMFRKPSGSGDGRLRDVSVEYSQGSDGRLDLVSSLAEGPFGSQTFHGTAEILDGANSRWEISYPNMPHGIPFLVGDVYIIKVDVDYRTAMMGVPNRHGLTLLHRAPVLDPAETAQWLRIAVAQGFDTSDLVWPIHSGCEGSR